MASKKLAAASAEELEDLEMDMSPMIDMVFLLLIFFMVSSTLLINKIDPDVTIPVADNSKRPKVAAGRIVINIYEDGTFSDENSRPLSDDNAITEYVTRIKENMPPTMKPRILLRGHKTAIVKHSKKVVQAAGQAGVIDIIFSAYVR